MMPTTATFALVSCLFVAYSASLHLEHAMIGADHVSKPFETLSYDTIVQELFDLTSKHPRYAQVYSAQERYGLPSPGQCGDVECQQFVLHVTDHNTLEEQPDRPEVFFSGCLHGNEQVGPTAIMEAARLMVLGAVCHADPRAKECEDGVLASSPESVPWLARLVLTRSTVFMPVTNSLGYFNNQRGEGVLDPNRDFPYQQNPKQCMTTITARAVNEVWREHAFQLAITFHGGMVAMAYEWGSPNHPHRKNADGQWQDISPDHEAQAAVTAGLSRFAGGFKVGTKVFEAYPTGRMNELVYPVSGGMEDWAYAGSWDSGVVQCTPDTYGGYPGEKTRYNSAMLRALNILVEASDDKSPAQDTLGSREGLLDGIPSTSENANGHVARNVRLALMVVDLVEPYVEWASPLPRPPSTEQGEKGGARFLEATVDDDEGLDVEWEVGGAFEVDMTMLVWGKWPEHAETLLPEDWETLVVEATSQHRTSAVKGHAKWSGRTPTSPQAATATATQGTSFSGRASFAGLRGVGRRLEAGGLEGGDGDGSKGAFAFVMAVAAVDQSWADRTKWSVSPNLPPQSHFVGARTSSTWKKTNNGHVVRGRILWNSSPLKVRLSKQQPSRMRPTADSVDGGKRESWGGGYWNMNRTVPPFQRAVPKSKNDTQDNVQTGEGVLPQATVVAALVASFALLVFLMARRSGINGSRGPQGRRRGGGGISLGRVRHSDEPPAVRTGGRLAPDSGRRRVSSGVASADSGDERNPFLSTVEDGSS